MASRYTETSTSSYAASLLQEFDKTEAEIDSYFNWLKQLVEEKKLALQKKLRGKRTELEELVTSWKGQMEEIELMKQQLMNIGVKFNQTNALREETVKGLDTSLENLKDSIKIPKICFLPPGEKLKEAIESVDLMFVENDYKDRVLPIKSFERDSILSSMKAVAVSEDVEGEEKVRLKLGKMAFNTQSGHIFVVDDISQNILVFDQDGNVIRRLDEKFSDLTDLSIDVKNNYLFVIGNGGTTLFKFNLETLKLLTKKKIELKDNDNQFCLDAFNGEIYVGNLRSISKFSSEFELIQAFHQFVFIFQLYCHGKGIFFQSFFQGGLNMCNYNGDLIRTIPLPYQFLAGQLIEQLDIIPYPIYVDISDFILIANTVAHCISIITFGGDLVHTIKLESEEGEEGEKGEEVEGKKVLPTGIAVTEDNKIILSVVNSKFPLRIF